MKETNFLSLKKTKKWYISPFILIVFLMYKSSTFNHNEYGFSLIKGVRAQSNHDDSQGNLIICHPTNPSFCYPKIFVAEKEFKKVLPGQHIPKGLHVRLNFETGEKEAKILDSNEKDTENPNKPIEIIAKTTISKDLTSENTKVAVISQVQSRQVVVIKQEQENFTANTNSETKIHGKEGKPYMKDSSEKSKVTLKDRDAIVEFIGKFRTEKVAEIDSLLNTLIEIVHDIDWSYEFLRTDGAWDLMTDLMKSDMTNFRSKTLWVIGIALQNNPKIENFLMEKGIISILHGIMMKESEEEVLVKGVFALGSLLRSNVQELERFSEMRGFNTLLKLYQSHTSEKPRRKILHLMTDISDPDMFDQESKHKLFSLSKNDVYDWCEQLDKEISFDPDYSYERVELLKKIQQRKWKDCQLSETVIKILGGSGQHEEL